MLRSKSSHFSESEGVDVDGRGLGVVVTERLTTPRALWKTPENARQGAI